MKNISINCVLTHCRAYLGRSSPSPCFDFDLYRGPLRFMPSGESVRDLEPALVLRRNVRLHLWPSEPRCCIAVDTVVDGFGAEVGVVGVEVVFEVAVVRVVGADLEGRHQKFVGGTAGVRTGR